MIITRTPFRVSFVGGGTDLADYYRVEAGAVVSTAIDRYMYIVVNKSFDDTIRVSYSRTEIVKDVAEIRHPIVRETLKLVGADFYSFIAPGRNSQECSRHWAVWR